MSRKSDSPPGRASCELYSRWSPDPASINRSDEPRDRAEREKCFAFFVQSPVVFDPQPHEYAAVDEHDAALIGVSEHLGVFSESSQGDEDAYVVAFQLREEGSHVVDVLLRLLAFCLPLDATARGADGIGIGDKVETAIRTRRRNPSDAVPEGANELGALGHRLESNGGILPR